MGGFLTALVLGCTSFLLGTLAMHWSADHLVLWQSPVTADSVQTALSYYRSTLLALVSAPSSPSESFHSALWYLLHGVGVVGALGLLAKMVRGTQSNWLFDGATLFLYSCAAVAYRGNVVHYLSDLSETSPPTASSPDPDQTLRDLAVSHAVIAVALTGCVLLQVGQYYAERAEGEEDEKRRQEKKERREARRKRREAAGDGAVVDSKVRQRK